MKEYGLYQTNSSKELELLSIDEIIPVKSYKIADGTVSIARDAFFDVPFLEEISIPLSLRQIPDGCFSNAGSWASEEKGIIRVKISEDHPYFTVLDVFFCRKKEDGMLHMIRALEIPEHTVIPSIITSVGEGAFGGRYVKSIHVESMDTTIWFPASHSFYLEVLLGKFGKNGKIFDFKEYDRLLLFDHFNPERIRMLCARLTDPCYMEEGMYEKIKENAFLHMEDLTEALIKNGDTNLLELLAQSGLFTQENIDAVTDQVGRSLRKDLMFWLMEYKNREFGITKDDLFI